MARSDPNAIDFETELSAFRDPLVPINHELAEFKAVDNQEMKA